MFRFAEEAECRLTDAQVETPLLAQGGAETREGHPGAAGAQEPEARPEPEQKHKEEHAHEDEHAHEHAHEEQHAHEPDDVPAHAHGNGPQSRAEAHADIDAAYRFTCAKPDALGQLEVGLFAAFPATLRVQAEYVVAAGQGAGVLTADVITVTVCLILNSGLVSPAGQAAGRLRVYRATGSYVRAARLTQGRDDAANCA